MRQPTPPERLNSLVKICYASIIEFHRGTSSMPKTVRQSSSSNSCWIILNLKSLIQISWDWNAQNINLFRIIGPGPVLLLTSFSSNPGKAFALKGNLSLWCSDPSWDSQLTSGSINIGWGSCHWSDRTSFISLLFIYDSKLLHTFSPVKCFPCHRIKLSVALQW